GGLSFAKLGADVIRFDQLGGGLDSGRCPLADNGDSLFWAGLKKGKRSLEGDRHSERGRELVQAFISPAGASRTTLPSRVSVSAVAFAMVGQLGRVAEAQLGSRDTPKDGNYLSGAFGHDFATSDGRRVMVVALTTRQWNALLEVTGLSDTVSAIEQAMGIELQ